MPPIRYFIVKQERQVKVAAPDLLAAAQFAKKIFDGETVTTGEGLNALRPVREISLNVDEVDFIG